MTDFDDASSGKKRHILSLDGGGIRGFFTIEVLAKIEEALRTHYRRPSLVLADHFDFVAGTSTGAIIGSLVAWGLPVSGIRRLYEDRAREMFRAAPLWQLGEAKYRHEALAEFMRGFFVEDDGTPALLGTAKLRTLFMAVMRNATTGSAWPVSNNPAALFNRRVNEDGTPFDECNLDIPLWKLVRASTAAPWFFPAEEVAIGPHEFTFVDGGITPYNNPALIALLTATLPAYRIEWPTGPERIGLVSVGTGQTRTVLGTDLISKIRRLSLAASVPGGLMESISQEQDALCRVLGETRFGAPLDMELGDLTPSGLLAAGEKKFAYTRYNRRFSREEIEVVERKLGRFGLDNLELIPMLQSAGATYAAEHVRVAHLV